MSVQTILDSLFKTDDSKELMNTMRKYGSKCNSFIEFGTRGGVSAIVGFQALLDNKTNRWKPRFVGADLATDESINNLKILAEQNGISFQFWQGHVNSYPKHETDGFIWDTFHCGGNLINDLEAIAPYTQKYIFILGTKMDGEVSEAVRRNLDFSQVARELQIDENTARMGLKQGIREFLDKNTDWFIICEIGELTILGRNSSPQKKLYR